MPDVLGQNDPTMAPGMSGSPAPVAPTPPPAAIFAQNPVVPQTQQINNALATQNQQAQQKTATEQSAGDVAANVASKATSFIPVVGPFVSAGISGATLAANTALAAGKQGPTQLSSTNQAQNQQAAQNMQQAAQNKQDDTNNAIKNAAMGGAAIASSFIPVVGPFVGGGIALANLLTNKKKYGGLA